MPQLQHKQAAELFDEYQSRVQQPILDSWIEKASLAVRGTMQGELDEKIMHSLPVKSFFTFTIKCCDLDAEIDAGKIRVTIPFAYAPGETLLMFTNSEFHVKDNTLCFTAETEATVREQLDMLKELDSAVNQELARLNTELTRIVKDAVQKRLDEEEARRTRDADLTARLREWACQ